MKDFEMTIDEYLPLRDVVFNTLRRAILKGELEPGERLMRLHWPTSWESAEHRSVKQFVSWSWKALL